MKLKELSLNDCERVRQWRNENLAMLRTPFLLTKEMQEQFYHDVICNRNAQARFWALVGDNNIAKNVDIYGNFISTHNTELLGMIGLENISWENRNAEISLILDPAQSTPENMTTALDLLLKKAFNELNLENVFTEVYACNPYIKFWVSISEKYEGMVGDIIRLPYRKYYDGVYYDSFYININRERYYENSSA